MTRSEQLDKAAQDIIDLVTKGLLDLNEADKKFGPNEARMLELYNKIVTVCLSRESGKIPKNHISELSDDELEGSFE